MGHSILFGKGAVPHRSTSDGLQQEHLQQSILRQNKKNATLSGCVSEIWLRVFPIT